MTKPFLKWAGGKGKVAAAILSQLPERIETYCEPFLGAGAVFFAMEPGRAQRVVLSDTNWELITTFRAVQKNVEALIELLSTYPYDKDFYYKMRAQSPLDLGDVEIAARMIYLNRTCFNGLYRVNKKGEFNAPFGKYTNPTICDPGRLRAAAAALNAVETEIFCDDFGIALGLGEGDAVYFDPPYYPLSATSNFVAYTDNGFGGAEHLRLRDVMREVAHHGAVAVLTNSDCEAMRKLYSGCGLKIGTLMAPRRINCQAGKRGDVSELLVTTR